MKTWTQRLSGLLLLALLGLSALSALREGWSSVLREGVQATVYQWATEQAPINSANLTRTEDFLQQALALTPNDPELLLASGALYWWRAWREGGGASMNKALDGYRRAIALRPAWPDGWLYLAHLKYSAAQWDDEFQLAYARAWTLGPWRKRVVWDGIELGFNAWSRLSADNRKLFLNALPRAALMDAKRLYRMAKSSGRLYMVCLGVRENRHIRDSCRKQGYLIPVAQ